MGTASASFLEPHLIENLEGFHALRLPHGGQGNHCIGGWLIRWETKRGEIHWEARLHFSFRDGAIYLDAQGVADQCCPIRLHITQQVSQLARGHTLDLHLGACAYSLGLDVNLHRAAITFRFQNPALAIQAYEAVVEELPAHRDVHARTIEVYKGGRDVVLLGAFNQRNKTTIGLRQHGHTLPRGFIHEDNWAIGIAGSGSATHHDCIPVRARPISRDFAENALRDVRRARFVND